MGESGSNPWSISDAKPVYTPMASSLKLTLTSGDPSASTFLMFCISSTPSDHATRHFLYG